MKSQTDLEVKKENHRKNIFGTNEEHLLDYIPKTTGRSGTERKEKAAYIHQLVVGKQSHRWNQ